MFRSYITSPVLRARPGFFRTRSSLSPSAVWTSLGVPSISVSVRKVTTEVKTASRTPRYTQAEDEQIVSSRRDGYTWERIAGNLGRSKSSIYARFYHYLQHSQPENLRPHCKDPVRDAASKALSLEILRLVDVEGFSFSEVGRRVGIGPKNVRTRYDTVCSPDKRSNGTWHVRYTQREIEAIASGIRQGQALGEIARSSHLDRTTESVKRSVSKTESLRKLWLKSASRVRFRFTTDEDSVLQEAIRTGDICPTALAKKLGRPRTSIVARLRILRQGPQRSPIESNGDTERRENQNLPRVAREKRVPWTRTDDLRLLARPEGERLHWDSIAKLFPGRSTHAVLSRYFALKSKEGFQPHARHGYAPPASAKP